MEQRKQSFLERHRQLSATFLTLVATLITLLGLEFGFRFGRDLVKGSDLATRAEIIDHPEFGWSLNPDKHTILKTNACGETVVRGAPISKYLLKQSPSPDRVKVLFVGDSFTQGSEVSSNAMYYEIFEASAKGRYAVSAAGVGGYSTAQEYMLLNKVLESFIPQVVFWQMTANDVAENVYFGTDVSTVQKPRVYYDLRSDSFVMRNPSLRILQYSEFAKFVYGELMKIERAHPFGLPRAMQWLTRQGDQFPAAEIEQKGLEVARRLIGRAIKEHPHTLFIGFSVDSQYDSKYQALFEKQGGLYLAALPAQMRQASKQRLECLPIDGHWNHEGNRVAGELLLQYLAREPALSALRTLQP